MKHYQWSELDYVAGAAHMEGMSYGRYVAIGMPNLQRFKRRADAGEFDHKPVRARSRAEKPKEPKPAPVKKERFIPQPVHVIPESKCQRCGVIMPAETRAGRGRKYCAECVHTLRNERQREYHKRVREKKAAGETGDGQSLGQLS